VKVYSHKKCRHFQWSYFSLSKLLLNWAACPRNVENRSLFTFFNVSVYWRWPMTASSVMIMKFDCLIFYQHQNMFLQGNIYKQSQKSKPLGKVISDKSLMFHQGHLIILWIAYIDFVEAIPFLYYLAMIILKLQVTLFTK